MIHRDQQVAGRSASRRASVDFPAAIFPHRRYNVVMRSGFPGQGGPLRGQLLFLTQKRSPRDSQTAQRPIERCTLGGQVKAGSPGSGGCTVPHVRRQP